MAKLVWDAVGQRIYETGVDHGVLYIPDSQGAYVNGVAWNGLTGFTESPSGGEATPQYADNLKYLNLYSAEQFEGTLEAFTWPPEFDYFNGIAKPIPGVSVGQQNRGSFGFCYRTLKGNDVEGQDYGYKLHLVYGVKASPSEQAHTTVNDTPSPETFSWALTATPVPMPSPLKPSATIVIDSTEVDADRLAALEAVLYGSTGVDPALPSPATVITMLSDDSIIVTAEQPAFDSGTNTITIPTVTGVTYYIDDLEVPAGDVVITENKVVQARANAGYILTPDTDDDWAYVYTP